MFWETLNLFRAKYEINNKIVCIIVCSSLKLQPQTRKAIAVHKVNFCDK